MSFRAQIRGASSIAAATWSEESNQGQRFLRLWKAVAWQARKRTLRKPVFVTLFNEMRFRAYPDCTCSSAAVYFRVPGGRHLRFLRACADGGIFLDVGANVGLVSVLLADKVQHGLLFEPNPIAAARARENVRINGLRFEVHEVALSDQSGTVAFEDNGGVNSCNRTLVGSATSSRVIMVPRMAFDDFLERRGPLRTPITLVKIDVEGHENWVRRGMRQLLSKQRPTVMFEYLQRTNLAETFEIFSGVGYRVIALSPEGEPGFASLDVPPLQDLFAVPVERADKFLESRVALAVAS